MATNLENLQDIDRRREEHAGDTMELNELERERQAVLQNIRCKIEEDMRTFNDGAWEAAWDTPIAPSPSLDLPQHASQGQDSHRPALV